MCSNKINKIPECTSRICTNTIWRILIVIDWQNAACSNFARLNRRLSLPHSTTNIYMLGIAIIKIPGPKKNTPVDAIKLVSVERHDKTSVTRILSRWQFPYHGERVQIVSIARRRRRGKLRCHITCGVRDATLSRTPLEI